MLTPIERSEFTGRCMAAAAAGIEFMTRSYAQLHRYQRERRERVMGRVSKQWYEVTLIEKDGEKREFDMGRYYAETGTAAIEKAKTKHRGSTKRLALTNAWEYGARSVEGEKPIRGVAQKLKSRPLFEELLGEEKANG